MAAFTREELKGGDAKWRFATRVRFQDVDVVGIVFFARYFEFVHDAYAELLRQRGLPLEGIVAAADWALPLRHVECDYLRPLRTGEAFEVQLVKAVPGERDLTFGWRVCSADGTVTYAVATTVHAAIDVKAFRGIALPAALREALRDLLA